MAAGLRPGAEVRGQAELVEDDLGKLERLDTARADQQVHVMHRLGKDGLGAAYLAGFQWALENGYDVIVEMDADGSHAPEQLHRLLDAVNGGADLAIGSRYVTGGSTVNWPKRREILSRGANTYARLALGSKIRDITAGFRAYRRAVLEIGSGTVRDLRSASSLSRRTWPSWRS